MIPILITVGAGAVAALALRVFTRPATFRVQRSIMVDAPPERVYPLLADFHRWVEWSPWEKLDPALRRTFSGADQGPGAVYSWVGNKKAGEGRMEITEASPPSRVSVNLDFKKPFESHNITDFTIQPHGARSQVTWVMHGPNTMSAKLMQSFISMDRLVGGDFEAGLASIKALAEKE